MTLPHPGLLQFPTEITFNAWAFFHLSSFGDARGSLPGLNILALPCPAAPSHALPRLAAPSLASNNFLISYIQSLADIE